MHLGLVLDMAQSGLADRGAVTFGDRTFDHGMLIEYSWAASSYFTDLGVPSVIYLGSNHFAYPVALFGAAGAGVPFIPLNYRLGAEQLAAQYDAHVGSFVIYEGVPPPFADPARSAERQDFVDSLRPDGSESPLPPDPDLPCVLLYTSGTTAAPKAAVLRHRHLMSYLLGTVEFASAEEGDATLVSVPPYHVAGVANLLQSLRRPPDHLSGPFRSRDLAADRPRCRRSPRPWWSRPCWPGSSPSRRGRGRRHPDACGPSPTAAPACRPRC